ncbi:ccr4 associated factor [Diplodia intermedia]|uniref:Iron-sulfur cluster assembly factor IBA57 homolog, mitochondrial n=1 Tax=Diplodia intermedia TaxID=856260 RepID=A0ABR3T677_9PEZI
MLSRPSAGSSAAAALLNASNPFICTRCLHLRRASSAAAATTTRNNGPSTILPRSTPSPSSAHNTTRLSIRGFATTSPARSSSAAHAANSSSSSSSSNDRYNGSGITPLPHRRLLALSGPDAPKFLQGLTTNNVLAGDGRDAAAAGWYTAFLNAQGRVLYDALVYATPHAAGSDGSAGDWACFIEVDGSCVNELHRLLRRHKLRSRIKLRVVDEGEWGVWAAWMADGSPDALPSSLDKALTERRVVHLPDTRVPGFGGHRLLVRRYLHGLAEGPAEMRVEEALPLESNVDLMRGVDFRKGCYIGQELTIRTKHTGVVRKRILPVRLYDLDGEEPERLEFVEGGVGGVKGEDVPPGVADVKKIAEGAPQADAEQGAAAPPPARRRKDGRSAGKWLAGVGNVGLALCRLEMMTDVKVAAEGMGPASGGYQPGMKFGLKWTVPGEQGEQGVGVKAFVPEWHRLRVEEEAKSKKKKIVQREFELDDE